MEICTERNSGSEHWAFISPLHFFERPKHRGTLSFLGYLWHFAFRVCRPSAVATSLLQSLASKTDRGWYIKKLCYQGTHSFNAAYLISDMTRYQQQKTSKRLASSFARECGSISTHTTALWMRWFCAAPQKSHPRVSLDDNPMDSALWGAESRARR